MTLWANSLIGKAAYIQYTPIRDRKPWCHTVWTKCVCVLFQTLTPAWITHAVIRYYGPALGYAEHCVVFIATVRHHTAPKLIQYDVVKTPRSRVLLDKLTGSLLVNKSPHFMEPHSQVPTTCPFSEPHQSNPRPSIPLLEDTS